MSYQRQRALLDRTSSRRAADDWEQPLFKYVLSLASVSAFIADLLWSRQRGTLAAVYLRRVL